MTYNWLVLRFPNTFTCRISQANSYSKCGECRPRKQKKITQYSSVKGIIINNRWTINKIICHILRRHCFIIFHVLYLSNSEKQLFSIYLFILIILQYEKPGMFCKLFWSYNPFHLHDGKWLRFSFSCWINDHNDIQWN